MKILLLNLPWVKGAMHGVRAGSRWPHLKHKPEDRYLPFPFFLAYATSLLKKNGFEAKLLDAIAEGRDHDKTLSFIKEYSPTHLVVETSFITLQGDLDFLKALTHPCVKILVGPNTYIASGSFLQEHPYIDHIIKGEYEFPLLELVRSTDQRSRSVIVPNSLCDLNALPWPERNDVLLEKYHDTPGGIPEPSAQMIASRGCPFHCTFCLWPHVMFGGHSYRIRDHIDVINEMEWLAQRGFKSIYFDDDTFGLDKKWLKAFCEELIRRNRECRINVPWAMMTRADHMDREMLLLLKKAECAAIKYGVESSSPAILKNAGKEYDLIALERIVTLTKSLNIKVHLTFTLGLPGETHATARDSIAYSFHLDPDSVQFSLATPFPGTPFYDLVKGKGLLLTEDVSLYDGNYHVVARTEGLAAGEIMRYKKKAYFLWKIYDRCKRIGRPLPRLSKLFIYTSLYGVGTSYKKLLHFIKNSLQLRKRFHDRLRYLGFYHGEKAFIGPSIIQLDLTNDCNNDCIACWCNSPLLEEKRLTGTIKSMHLSFEKVKEVIDDAARLGTQEIFLSGGGEPFMHPNIMDIITYIKSKGLIVHINTNFTLLDEATIRTIVEHGVDFMTVSLWAGSPKVYSDTHPNKTEDDFRRIERLLKYVQCLRTPNAPPHVKLYHVISNINYRDLAMMYDIAVRTESESVE
ncbi:MAG: radical SAM protein, partial [Candidatus Omnitrophica bacterium]|nr:radical SAM protein [Candidatus Omnitrophota bacterium]